MQPVNVLLLFIIPLAAAHKTKTCEADAEALIQTSLALVLENDAAVVSENDAAAFVQTSLAAEAADSEALIQHSLTVMSENDIAKDAHESHMSGEQLRLHSDLQSARKARHAVLTSLQKWDQRVSALEKQLSASMQVKAASLPVVVDSPVLPVAPAPTAAGKMESIQAIVRERKMAQCCVLTVLIVLLVVYMIRTVSQYEANRDEDTDLPWYHNSSCMGKVLAAGGLLWLMLGISMFTQLMLFTSEHRHLSVIESMYLTTQIVTTVGYGDLTPTTDIGKVLLVLYALTGVSVIGALLQQLLLSNEDPDKEHVVHSTHSSASHNHLGKHHKLMVNILPVLACVIFGTMFYSLYPGEDKTVFEAFYMSIISLLTIGFGAFHPTTEVGKLVSCAWLLVGVAYMGEAIVDVTQRMFEKRHNLRTKAATSKLFAEIDVDKSGTIDRMEFLTFELVRNGLPQKKVANTVVTSTEIFDKLDTDKSGELDYDEFEKYVVSLEKASLEKK